MLERKPFEPNVFPSPVRLIPYQLLSSLPSPLDPDTTMSGPVVLSIVR